MDFKYKRSANVDKLLGLLRDFSISGQILFGQQNAGHIGVSINATDGTESDCKNLTGSHPAIVGIDTLSFLGYEGKMNDRTVALPVLRSKLRLYCLRLSDSVLIVGNGGEKKTRTYDEDPELSGYVLTLQKLDELLKSAELKGTICIEETTIEGIDEKTFEI